VEQLRRGGRVIARWVKWVFVTLVLTASAVRSRSGRVIEVGWGVRGTQPRLQRPAVDDVSHPSSVGSTARKRTFV